MSDIVYQKRIEIRAEHVDFKRKMRPSSLLRFFQECCIAHTEELGFDRSTTLDKGLLWVVACERLLINKMPEYGETILLECYPGKMLHYLFPRHFLVKNEKGEILIRGIAIWALIEEKTRSIIEPKEYGILIEGEEHGEEIPPLMRLPDFEGEALPRSASYSLADINGHINNASYLDLAFDLVSQADLIENELKEIDVVFQKEIPFGQTFDFHWKKEKKSYCFRIPEHFSLRLLFEKDVKD